jgi:biotin carboxyl carrier protein
VIVDVEISGTRRQVELIRTKEGWRAMLDGRELTIDLAQVSQWRSLLVGHSSHEVAIDARGRGELVVHVDGVAVPVAVIDPRAAFGRRDHDRGAGGGPKTIVAPMPGRVVKILVKPGDEVAARQGLVVVEAMKMENELRAPRDGRVAEIRVAEGASVEANAILVVIE